MTWQTVVEVVLPTLLGAAIIALLRLWKRQAAIEQTLYGQPGEPGLLTRFEALKEEVKDRDHTTRGKMQEAVGELETRIRALERLVPR